jgi:hypothetical protein
MMGWLKDIATLLYTVRSLILSRACVAMDLSAYLERRDQEAAGDTDVEQLAERELVLLDGLFHSYNHPGMPRTTPDFHILCAGVQYGGQKKTGLSRLDCP